MSARRPLAWLEHSDGIAVVTGATGGIGRGVCEVLSQAGLHVVGLDVDIDTGDSPLPGVELIQVDVADADAVARVAEDLSRRSAPTRVLVNNAGVLGAKTGVVELELEEWERVLRINLTSAFLCSKAIAPLMEAHGFGRIVNISSLGAQTGAVHASAAYTSSKGGMIALTRTMSRELARVGITVNTVSPARIDGPVFWQAEGDLGKTAAERVPVGRLGTPLDIAFAVAYLASPQAGFVTAQTLNVNGGVWAS